MTGEVTGYPKAICYMCGKRYSGWILAERKTCDCGGKLIVDFPYSVLIGSVSPGTTKDGK